MPSKSTLEHLWTDFYEAISLGFSRGHRLLTSGEVVIARNILGLDATAGQAYAWLIQRKPALFFEPELDLESFDDWGRIHLTLSSNHLIDNLVPWSQRAHALPTRLLRPACAALGLSSRGTKADLCERLDGRKHWIQGAWLRPRHHILVQRLLRFATLRVRPNLEQRTLDRIYERRWPEYPIVSDLQLFINRGSMRAWETLVERLDTLSLTETQDVLARQLGRAPGRLDRTRALVRHLSALSRIAEREGQYAKARAGYNTLITADPLEFTGYLLRWARCCEHAGDCETALDRLLTFRSKAIGPDRLAINRTIRRIARKTERRTGPDKPLNKPPLRTLSLEHGGISVQDLPTSSTNDPCTSSRRSR